MDNNKKLYQLYNEVQQMKGTAFGHLLKGRIADFEKNNGIRINTLCEKIRNVRSSHFILDKDLNVQYHPAEEGKAPEPIMVEGKTKEMADKAYNDLMDEPTIII